MGGGDRGRSFENGKLEVLVRPVMGMSLRDGVGESEGRGGQVRLGIFSKEIVWKAVRYDEISRE